jgi:hypothetical protein
MFLTVFVPVFSALWIAPVLAEMPPIDCVDCLKLAETHPDWIVPAVTPEIFEFEPKRWRGPLAIACNKHFVVGAHTFELAQETCSIAEKQFAQLQPLLGFESLENKGLYTIYVYGDSKEYVKKTRQPAWTGGVTPWNKIYIYDNHGVEQILRHELVHLIMTENLGMRLFFRGKWLTEGLASLAENESPSLAQELPNSTTWYGIPYPPFSFAEMLFFRTYKAEAIEYAQWYRQSADVVRFIIHQCGMKGLREFLKNIQTIPLTGMNVVEKALSESCGGRWASIKDLESEWAGKTTETSTAPVTQAMAANADDIPASSVWVPHTIP